MRIQCKFAAAIVMASLVASPAAGTTLHDTTGVDIDVIPNFGTFLGGVEIQLADAFVVSGGDFLLESITVQLRRTSGDGDFVIRLWDDDGGLPGTILESFAVDGNLPEATDVTVNSVVFSTLNDGGTYWVSTAMPDNTSSGNWTLVETEPVAAAIVFDTGPSPDWLTKTRETARYLRVTGTAVPEPATWVLACCGVAGLAAAGRRRLA